MLFLFWGGLKRTIVFYRRLNMFFVQQLLHHNLFPLQHLLHQELYLLTTTSTSLSRLDASILQRLNHMFTLCSSITSFNLTEHRCVYLDSAANCRCNTPCLSLSSLILFPNNIMLCLSFDIILIYYSLVSSNSDGISFEELNPSICFD